MMKQFYAVIALLAVINSLATAYESLEIKKLPPRQNQPSASASFLGALLSKNEFPLISLLEKGDKSNDSGSQSYNRSTVYSRGNIPDASYPSSDLLTYGTNCDFAGGELYRITNVPDLLKCGAQYCAGESQCTHFTYSADKTCFLKTKFGLGSSATKSSDYHCGLIPFRACPINTASVTSLMNCVIFKATI